jgi:UDP-4-amino-4-deoxy-L-arabinose formyltransferase/UDP-glucuronic acid dehydrogenase (UDP-4-keto-hexauronic acid decarboxylating)
MRIAVLGRTHWLLSAARQLQSVGHDIVLVATAPAQPEYGAYEEDYASFAELCGCPYLLSPDINGSDFIGTLKDLDVDLSVSINWPSLIGPETCAATRCGVFNCHGGDLPRYRGNACASWAILRGEPKVGLCIHAMDPHELDAGPIFARRYLTISEATYIGDVLNWFDSVVPGAYLEAVSNLQNSDFVPEDQSRIGIRPLRCHPRRPEDGEIDWSQSAAQVVRLVRASSRPYRGAYASLEGKESVTIWKARVVDPGVDLLAVPGQIMGAGERGPFVACASGVIEIEEAEMQGGGSLPHSNRYRFTLRAPSSDGAGSKCG